MIELDFEDEEIIDEMSVICKKYVNDKLSGCWVGPYDIPNESESIDEEICYALDGEHNYELYDVDCERKMYFFCATEFEMLPSQENDAVVVGNDKIQDMIVNGVKNSHFGYVLMMIGVIGIIGVGVYLLVRYCEQLNKIDGYGRVSRNDIT